MLCGGVFACYLSVFNYGFVRLDNQVLFLDNENVNVGMTVDGLRWAFEVSGHDWVPLAYVSWMLDFEFFGANARGFHLINVLFHAANAVILFFLIKSMTGAVWKSALVAALFAFHPQRVESVAWIAERRDVLFTFFGLLALWAYVIYIRKPNALRYLYVLGLFALCLMSKQMLVTFPFLLLLLDHWPLDRYRRGKIRTLIIEKIPLLVMSLIETAISFSVVYRYSEAMSTSSTFSWSFRLFNGLTSYVSYLKQTVWPTGLAIYYPLPSDFPVWQIVISALVMSLITLVVLMQFRRRPFVVIGYLWFLGTLLPSIVITHSVYSWADRYTYFPSIGLAIVVVWAMSDLVERVPRVALAGRAAVVALCVFLCAASFVQVGYWRDTPTLWRRSIDVTENNWYAHSALATELMGEGKLNESVFHFEKTVVIRPQNWKAHYNLATALVLVERAEDAVRHFELAKDIQPRDSAINMNLGTLLFQLGRYDQAARHLGDLVSIVPDDSVARFRLGSALVRTGEYERAVEHLEKALELDSGNQDAARKLQQARALRDGGS
jgi:Flp pilus assembly protein TadD